jgi:hypothetical protein
MGLFDVQTSNIKKPNQGNCVASPKNETTGIISYAQNKKEK